MTALTRNKLNTWLSDVQVRLLYVVLRPQAMDEGDQRVLDSKELLQLPSPSHTADFAYVYEASAAVTSAVVLLL